MTYEQRMARLWTMAERGLVGQMSDADLGELKRWADKKGLETQPIAWIEDEVDQRLEKTGGDLAAVAKMIDPWAAQVGMAMVMAILCQTSGADMIDQLTGVANDLRRDTVLPDIDPDDPVADEFWRAVRER